MLDIIILAIVAFLIYKKLFQMLGDTKYDREISSEDRAKFEQFRQSISKVHERQPEADDNQIEIASRLEAELSESDRHTFDVLRKSDSTFTAEKFTKGAKMAFEMILKALAEGNRPVLKQLLASDVYKAFDQDITNRESSQQINEITIVSVKECVIKSTSLSNHNKVATIVVAFTSEQIKVNKDKLSGSVISGSSSRIIEVNDTWSFAKEVSSSSNIWKLVAVHDSRN